MYCINNLSWFFVSPITYTLLAIFLAASTILLSKTGSRPTVRIIISADIVSFLAGGLK